jgi:hypothetical protein
VKQVKAAASKWNIITLVNKESNLPVPERKSTDLLYDITKAAISAVPGIGGPAAELLAIALISPLEKRRDEWMSSVAVRLQAAELRLDKLADDPAFVTTLVHATQIASRNHQEEKLSALRNAVVNSALGNAPAEDLRALFLTLVDELTPTHLRILRLFESSGSVGSTRQQLAAEREVTDQMVLRLSNSGLIDDPRPYAGRMREHPEPLVTLAWTPSKLGKRFLEFITSSS